MQIVQLYKSHTNTNFGARDAASCNILHQVVHDHQVKVYVYVAWWRGFVNFCHFDMQLIAVEVY